MPYTLKGVVESIGVQVGQICGDTAQELADTITSSNKDILVTSTLILAANTSRSFLSLTNNNEYDVWVNFGSAAIVGDGMLLGAYGGSILLDRSSITTKAIYGIASGGTNNIGTSEGVDT